LNSETKLCVIEGRIGPRIEWNGLQLCVLATCLVFLLVHSRSTINRKIFSTALTTRNLAGVSLISKSVSQSNAFVEAETRCASEIHCALVIERISLTRYDSLFRMNLGHRFLPCAWITAKNSTTRVLEISRILLFSALS
jgi:hypothetical protein